MKEIKGYEIVKNDFNDNRDCTHCAFLENANCDTGYFYKKIKKETKEDKEMKSKIKFRLEVWETTIIFQVLEMDERFKHIDNTFTSKNGIEIWSHSSPELACETKIYLRGIYKEDALRISFLECESKENAIKTKQNIIIALKDWAENWVGFKEDKEGEIIDTNKTIFEF